MITEVVIPMLGITVERGRIVEWLKKEGERVEKGEILFVVETEKVTTEVESPASGILAKILVPAGMEVPVLTVVGVITEPGEELPDKYKQMPGKTTQLAPSEVEKTFASQSISTGKGASRAVPAARKLAKEMGVDIGTLTGSGPGGIIVVRDVQAALQRREKPKVKATPLATKMAEEAGIPLHEVRGSGAQRRILKQDVEKFATDRRPSFRGKVIPMDNMRKTIAKRMTESAFTAPHIYFFTDVWMDPVMEFRKEIIPKIESKFALRPSINDILIKAVALNLKEFPMLNAMVKGEEIHVLPEINIGIAVALPVGLIVPAIANADKVGLVDIIRQREELVEKARKGNLSMAEIERGTFTISSLAQYDITCFTAILNPPQSAILSVGKTRGDLWLVDGKVKERNVATFGLAVDHRIIDGAVAADFLQNLKWKIEKPWHMFLSF